ncbi:plasmid mobilization relaxosome protein MobC, partial [Acinetobacter harbinensis]|uniref:plasmid mobilization relaxosome protein MobC n=1 Tax=Acinetobacter harbinensis TaxID=1353941 RepID=UPI001C4F05EF
MRSKNKIFRLTELQLEQLEKHLKKEGTTFTDFIHSLIQREVMQDAVTVRLPTEEELKPRTKIKTVIEVIKRYQKTDPNVLLELSKIGNNVNQIARALNVIKNADPQEQRK